MYGSYPCCRMPCSYAASSSRSSSREDKIVGFLIICVANILCARSEGQFAMAVGNPINARALTGCAGESEKICWCKGNI